MSTKRQERKEEGLSQTHSTSEQYFQREQQQQAVNKVIDETKDNIKKTIDEARKEIPRYTQIVNNYQENTIQAIEITDNYVESQKDILSNSLRLWSDWTVSPRQLAENYGKIVSNFADNAVAATRVINNMVFANLDSVNTSVQHTKENIKELSKIGANTVKTFQQVTRDNIHKTTTNSSK